MNKFFNTPECRSGSHCHTCRARTAGTTFRKSIATYFKLPTIDWPCPHNRPWELNGQVVPLPTIEALKATEDVVETTGEALGATDEAKTLINNHAKICRECDEFTGNHCERQFPTGCCLCTWHKFLQEGQCPAKPPKWVASNFAVSGVVGSGVV